jgi:hypothetical protein
MTWQSSPGAPCYCGAVVYDAHAQSLWMQVEALTSIVWHLSRAACPLQEFIQTSAVHIGPQRQEGAREGDGPLSAKQAPKTENAQEQPDDETYTPAWLDRPIVLPKSLQAELSSSTLLRGRNAADDGEDINSIWSFLHSAPWTIFASDFPTEAGGQKTQQQGLRANRYGALLRPEDEEEAHDGFHWQLKPHLCCRAACTHRPLEPDNAFHEDGILDEAIALADAERASWHGDCCHEESAPYEAIALADAESALRPSDCFHQSAAHLIEGESEGEPAGARKDAERGSPVPDSNDWIMSRNGGLLTMRDNTADMERPKIVSSQGLLLDMPMPKPVPSRGLIVGMDQPIIVSSQGLFLGMPMPKSEPSRGLIVGMERPKIVSSQGLFLDMPMPKSVPSRGLIVGMDKPIIVEGESEGEPAGARKDAESGSPVPDSNDSDTEAIANAAERAVAHGDGLHQYEEADERDIAAQSPADTAPARGQTVKVTRVHPAVDDETIRLYLGSYGDITNLSRHKPQQGLGYAFVTYKSAGAAECAALVLNDNFSFHPSQAPIGVKLVEFGAGLITDLAAAIGGARVVD